MNKRTSINIQKIAYSIPEYCEATSMGRTQIYKAIKEGKLIARKMGKRTLITYDDGLNFLNSLPVIED
jgi:excisionase family DNA binding protein